MSVIYAIGDVHGRDDLLEELHARIVEDRRTYFADHPATLVYVGDYIDRGPDSAAVIDRVRAGLDGFATVALLGNHEAMLLACLDRDDDDAWALWLMNGGAGTCRSLGLGNGDRDAASLAEALGPGRLGWLRGLGLRHEEAGLIFVHAGLRPGRPLAAQSPDDLLWIREPFLLSAADHGALVIHGHTPSRAPVVQSNRICVDTGAVFSGVLTAVILRDGAAMGFVSTGDGDAAHDSFP